jgi:CRP/FNR family transcriptional regulator, cyclic AMP receptor protein
MSRHELENLAKVVVTRAWAKGDLILQESGANGDIYIVFDGILLENRYSRAGREVDFLRIVPGGYFGEIAAIDRGGNPTNVIALTRARVGRIPEAAVNGLLAASPHFGRALLEGLAASVRRFQMRLFEMNTLTVASRLHVELMRMAVSAGIRGNRATIVDSPTHAEFAALLGGQREAITREFSRLVTNGVVEPVGRVLKLLDVAALSEVAESAGADPANSVMPASRAHRH